MKLTVASYNISHGAMVDYDIRKLVQSIVECGADVIGVQEVDVDARRSGNRDIATLMAQELGFHVRFAKTIDLQGGAYGTAILSRYPIDSFVCFPLESGKYEKRSAGAARIKIGDEVIHFWNTHLSYENLEQRRVQLEQLKGLLPTGEPWILTGDFNTGNFDELRILGKVSMVNDFEHVHKTFRTSGTPIDNIIYTSPWSVIHADIVDNDHSDHNLLYAVMEA